MSLEENTEFSKITRAKRPEAFNYLTEAMIWQSGRRAGVDMLER